MHPLDRSGIAALSDLQTAEWRALFRTLEQQQSEFLSREAEFRSPSYRWARDPLHTWSRVWEYPYVYYHLAKWRSGWKGERIPHVVDVGSGVTFFPFAVANLQCKVTCTDVDPICQVDLSRASRAVPHSGSVDFRLATGSELSFEDGEADAVYCVSVLEHIPHFEATIAEIARILRPDGMAVLTIDLDINGTSAISVSRHKDLVACLREYFDVLALERSTHVADQLTSRTGPYPMKPSSRAERAWFLAKQRIKPLLGRSACPLMYLAAQGIVLRRNIIG